MSPGSEFINLPERAVPMFGVRNFTFRVIKTTLSSVLVPPINVTTPRDPFAWNRYLARLCALFA